MSDFITIVVFVFVIIFLYILFWVFDWSEKDKDLHDELFMIVIALLGFPPLGILALIGNFLNFYPKARIEKRICTCLDWYNEKYWNNQGKIVPPIQNPSPNRSYVLERPRKVSDTWVQEHFLVFVNKETRINDSTGEDEVHEFFVIEGEYQTWTKGTSVEELQNVIQSVFPQTTGLPALIQYHHV